MSSTLLQYEELVQLNDDLENYFRNTIIPQLFVDANFILRKFTPPAMKQFKLTPGDIGKSIYDTIDNFRFPSIIDNIKYVIDTGESLEKEIQTTDYKWYQMNILPYIVHKTNETNGVIITFVDVTARIEDLKAQEKLISDNEILLDTISHDIKTPLTNLVLLVQLFKDVSPENSDDFQSLLKMVENAVTKMQGLIIDLTNTRMAEYQEKNAPELVNFEHIVEDVRLTIAENIKESGAEIRTEINVSEIKFSRRQLRSIIFNLVSNAIKFKSAERKAKVIIKTSVENDFIIISIKDNGIGIDASQLDLIFSKYFRLKTDSEGSGIGLYLVKEIVTKGGGRVEVESEPGKGSEFKIYLKA